MLYVALGLFYALAFILGSVLFSFINVVAYRLPRGENPFRGRSHCTACAHQLAPGDLIPVVSYLTLKARCRYCDEKVSPRYLVTEIAGGLLCMLCFMVAELPLALFYFAVVCVLATVAIADWDTQEIPDQCSIALALLGIAAFFVLPDMPAVKEGHLRLSEILKDLETGGYCKNQHFHEVFNLTMTAWLVLDSVLNNKEENE